MSWQQLLKDRKIRDHATTKQEVDDLRSVIARDLEDARLPGLSPDRRFATAYNAALQTCKMILACAGYRVASHDHHKTTLEAVQLALGEAANRLIAYFDTCRRKRNQLDYDMAGIIPETEAEEIALQVEELRRLAEDWISRHHPRFKA